MDIKWEYEIMPFPKTSLGIEGVKYHIKKYGDDSWELVSIINHPNPKDFESKSESPFFAIFKRQKVT